MCVWHLGCQQAVLIPYSCAAGGAEAGDVGACRDVGA
jgi:hypothetical protein